jgi:hypothetical protein
MIIHAAGESAHNVQPGTYAVALSSPNERALLDLERKLQYAEIPHAAFREPDYNDQLMSIGIYPVTDRRMVRRFLRNFPLLGEESWKMTSGKKIANG